MAITLNNIAASLRSQTPPSESFVQESTAANPASNADVAHLAQKSESAKVQLSAYGQIKSAFSDLQVAANTLADDKSTATSEGAKNTVQSFVSEYNKASDATKSTATQNEGSANNARAKLAGNDLHNALSAGSTPLGLTAIGIIQNKDGTLKVDSNTLDQALQNSPSQVQSTLRSIGNNVASTAARELAGGRNIEGSVNSFYQRTTSLESQQSSQQTQAAGSQQDVKQRTSQYNQSNAVAAYQKLYTR